MACGRKSLFPSRANYRSDRHIRTKLLQVNIPNAILEPRPSHPSSQCPSSKHTKVPSLLGHLGACLQVVLGGVLDLERELRISGLLLLRVVTFTDVLGDGLLDSTLDVGGALGAASVGDCP